jgi:hypothetical protein
VPIITLNSSIQVVFVFLRALSTIEIAIRKEHETNEMRNIKQAKHEKE